MAYSYNISALSASISDSDFELLLRYRIKDAFERLNNRQSNLSESHNNAVFYFSFNDTSKWSLSCGESYGKRVDAEGEVLAITVDDMEAAWNRKNRNKLSLLLNGPEVTEVTTIDGDDSIPF